MTFLRKGSFVIHHSCQNPQEEIQDLQTALSFAEPYLETTDKSLRTYKKIMQALKAKAIQKEKDCFLLEIQVELGMHDENEAADEVTNFRILLHELIVKIAQKKQELIHVQLKGKEVDLNFKATLSKTLVCVLDFAESLRLN